MFPLLFRMSQSETHTHTNKFLKLQGFKVCQFCQEVPKEMMCDWQNGGRGEGGWVKVNKCEWEGGGGRIDSFQNQMKFELEVYIIFVIYFDIFF